MIEIVFNGEVIDTADNMDNAEWMLAEYKSAFRKVEGASFSLSTKSSRAFLTNLPITNE